MGAAACGSSVYSETRQYTAGKIASCFFPDSESYSLPYLTFASVPGVLGSRFANHLLLLWFFWRCSFTFGKVVKFLISLF